MFNFEKLETWQKAIDFADAVYTATSAFPSDECFGLNNQLRRASVSISSNLAEGSSRHSRSDHARCVEIATGSLFEGVSQVYIARRREYLNETTFAKLYADAAELSRMLSGRRSYLIGDAASA